MVFEYYYYINNIITKLAKKVLMKIHKYLALNYYDINVNICNSARYINADG